MQTIPSSLVQIKYRLIILAGLLLFTLAARAHGPLLKQSYSFSKQSYTINELTMVMQQQADISISYDAQKIKSNTRVRLPKQVMTAKELAVLLQKNYQIQSKFIGTHILLKKEHKAPGRAKPKKAGAKKKKATPKEVAVTPVSTTGNVAQENAVVILEEAVLDTISSFADTFTVDKKVIAQFGWNIAPAAANFSETQNDIDRLDKPQVIDINPSWYERFELSFNLSGDEIFYLNPGVSLHWDKFAVTGNYAIKGSLSHFRFGASYTQAINNNVHITLWGNYGAMPKQAKVLNYQFDSVVIIPPDTTTIINVQRTAAYAISGNSLKIGINMDWQLGQNLELFSGLSYNRSQTEILYNDVAAAPYSFINPLTVLRGADFQLFPNILTISDNFSPSRANASRNWIGFQIGLRFYLFRSRARF